MSAASQSLSLPAAIESLAPATEFVRDGAREAGFTGDRLGEVDLVMEELFMNVASYAYPAGEPGAVEITWSLPHPGVLSVEIADRGFAFDPLRGEDPDLTSELSERPIGGLGIFLVRGMTSALDYRRDGDWNRLHFEMS